MTVIFERALVGLLWIGVISLMYKMLNVPLFDHDLWWHLACGREMVERHVFLRNETLSHTMNGAAWINFEWLSQILLYSAVKAGGIKTILAGKVALGFLVMLLLTALVRQAGARGVALAILTAAGFLILKQRLYERVELVTLVFMPLFLLLLTAARRDPPSRIKRTPWVLFGLMALWCNLHGGFIYGLGIVVLLNIGARWAREPEPYVALLDRSLALSLLAMLINPFGARLSDVFVEHLLQLSQGPALIQEWAPPSVRAVPVFWMLFMLASIAVVTVLLDRRKSCRLWVPLVVVFAVWGARHMRNAAYLPFFALPFLVRAALEDSRLSAFFTRRSVKVTALVLASAGVAAAAPKIYRVSYPATPLLEIRYPIGACKFLDENKVQGTLFNCYEYGGFIEWASKMDRKVFMDGRYLFQPLLVEHERLDRRLFENPSPSVWASFWDATQVDYAVTNYNTNPIPSKGMTPFPFTWANLAFPRESWALVYWDDAAMVFLKRGPRFDPLIQAFEYRSVWPYNRDQMRAMLEAKIISKESVEKELDRHRREMPFSIVRNEVEKCLPN